MSDITKMSDEQIEIVKQEAMDKERYSRQGNLVPREDLVTKNITIVGVGAIGRPLALQLASIGCQNIQLIDFDEVEISNVASQGYLEGDVGLPKVEATGNGCLAINSEINVTIINDAIKKDTEVGDVMFCCVDSIETRKFIFDNFMDKIEVFIDGRMSAETMRVIISYDDTSKAHYPTTLFKKEEAYVGECAAKTTIYSAYVASGMMVAQFAKWLRGVESIDPDFLFNMFAVELTVNPIKQIEATEQIAEVNDEVLESIS